MENAHEGIKDLSLNFDYGIIKKENIFESYWNGKTQIWRA